MPTYEYSCPGCGHYFEEFQSMSAAPVDECPNCSGKPKRIISGGAGFVFKGAGFYQTDYRSKEYKDAASKDKPIAAGESKPDSKKTDTNSKSEKNSDSKTD